MRYKYEHGPRYLTTELTYVVRANGRPVAAFHWAEDAVAYRDMAAAKNPAVRYTAIDNVEWL